MNKVKIGAAHRIFAALSLLLIQWAMPAQAQVTADTLLDRILIEDMMIDFYWGITESDRDHLDGYYLEDGVMEVNDLRFEGREAIKGAYANRRNENVGEGGKMKMLLGNPRIKIDGDTATMDSIWTGILNPDPYEEPMVLEQGTEYTELVKVNGQWRIKYRVIKSLSNIPDAWEAD